MKKEIETIKTEIDYIYNYLENNPLIKVERLDGTRETYIDDENLKSEIRKRLTLAIGWLSLAEQDDRFIGKHEIITPSDIKSDCAGIFYEYASNDYIRGIIYKLKVINVDSIELNQCYFHLVECKMLINNFLNIRKLKTENV